jgi:hypothetical protein
MCYDTICKVFNFNSVNLTKFKFIFTVFFLVLLQDDDENHPETPYYDWDNINYDGDCKDGPEDDQDEDDDKTVKDEPKSEKVEEATSAETKVEEKDEGIVSGPSNWKKRQARKKELKNAKKPRAEASTEVNTTLADEFKKYCNSRSDKNM